MSKIKALSLRAIFAAPLLIGVLSLIGLIAALLGDAAWDVAGWLGLAAPLIAFAWALIRAPAARPRGRTATTPRSQRIPRRPRLATAHRPDARPIRAPR